MIYLKEFRIPKDSWVDCYFSCPCAAMRHGYCPKDLPENMPVVCENSHLNTWYPWNTLYNRGLREFAFEDITILYGGNGSGKTTLLNVIAQHLRLNRLTRYNKSTCFDDFVSICEHVVTNLNAERCIQRGRILVSDDVFDAMLKKREHNEHIDQRREELVKEFFDMPDLPRKNLAAPEVLKDYKRIYDATKKGNSTCSKYVKANLRRNTKEQSNGETAFEFFVESIPEDSLVLLDEPENSLSAKWQMELVKYITGAIRAFNCQFIIATHSPFLLSVPGAKIYDLDSLPIKAEKWYNLENVRSYYELFKNNEHLFEPNPESK